MSREIAPHSAEIGSLAFNTMPGWHDTMVAMENYDDEPELAGYVEHTGKPLHGSHRLLILRIVVITGVICLILPQILTTASVASTTAQEACTAWVKYEASDASGASARFEIFGAGGVGWECYSEGGFGGGRHVASLGLIPISPKLAPVPLGSLPGGNP